MTNRLASEKSPYLKQHENNPVNWMPWNKGTLKLAKDKNYYSISGIQPSRNHKFIAYGEDLNGRREYSIVVKDINKNKIIEKNQCSSTGGVVWSTDSKGYFYLKKDPKTLITNSLFYHKLNSKKAVSL